MIRFVHPEAFLLALPVLLWLRRDFAARPLLALLRGVALCLLLGLLAEPYRSGAATGRDLVIVADRSLSVPPNALEVLPELGKLARDQARRGDRIGLLTFGRDTAIEAPPSPDWRYTAPQLPLDRDGSDLAQALETALALIPPGRQGSLLVVSDGESTGRDPLAAAGEAARRGITIDVVPLRRPELPDVAVDELTVPEQLAPDEPFLFSAWVRSDRATEVPVQLLRNGQVIASGKRTLRPGLNRLLFKDRLAAAGVHAYEVQLATEDRVPENNRAHSVVRVDGPLRVLCLTPGGRQDRLTRSLAAAGLAVDVRPAAGLPTTAEALAGYRAIVLENVPAQDLPPLGLRALQRFVTDLGGGLLMTGGKASFGVGGYHRSPVEDVLPVSLEIRQEQRKFGLAMAITLDRSGSMAAPVDGGLQKMDLANLGACAAIEMLGPLDAVSVQAVDSAVHDIVPLTAASDRAGLCARVRTIESMGGGIYVYAALVGAAQQLEAAVQTTKHIVLFADAADAEQPGEYKQLLAELAQKKVTVSVIGLGKETDSDAAFLKDVAARGGGRVFFSAEPNDLPRVFAHETIQAARSAMIEEPTDARILPDVLAIADLRGVGFPRLGGYSIAYEKPGATLGVVSTDEQKAPLFAFWQHGLGRAAAFLGEVDGPLAGDLASWDRYADFFATVARWLAGNEAPLELFSEIRREGHEGVVVVEVEAGKEALLGTTSARVLGPDGTVHELALERTGERRLEGRFALRAQGAYQAVLRTGQDQVLRAAPITLPYSPEFAPPADPAHGEKLLARIAKETGGLVSPAAHELLRGSREGSGIQYLGWQLCWWLVGVVLLEIAVRRLQLTIPWRLPRRVVGGFAARVRAAWLRLRRKPASSAQPTPSPPAADLQSILARAKERSQKRL